MQPSVKGLICGVLISVLSCVPLWGQSSTAEISGTVRDASGAVLPGVEISVTHADTGVSRAAVSNETGSYILPALPIGPYRLEATLPGFRTFIQSGIVLQINSGVVINPVLEVGQVTETVEVTANATMVEARSTGVGQVIDNAQILELPLIGRQVTDLVVLSGAAIQTGVSGTNSRSFPGVASFSIAGGLQGGTSFTLDGASHNDLRSSQSLPVPFPDALQEFKVETSAVPAQYGFRSGGAISAVTKSGTNQFHGTGFWFVRNEKFNARNYFSTRPDPLKRNQFGGTLGGPIQQNKLFFFGAYQGTTDRSSPSSSRSFVPTPAMLAGDFTAFASAACQGTNRNLTSPFQNNRIDPAQLSKAALAVSAFLPKPVDQCGLVNWGTASKRDEHQVIAKTDYHFSSTHSIFGRYMNLSLSSPAPLIATGELLTSPTAGFENRFQTLTIGDTYTIGSNIVNSLRFSFTHSNAQRTAGEYFSPQDVGVAVYTVIPKRLHMSVSNAFTLGGNTSMPNNYREGSVQISDDAGIIVGNHQVSFGGTLLGVQTNNHSTTISNGQFSFTGGITGLSLADFLAGRVAQFDQDNPSKQYVRFKYLGLYAQDSWRVRPGLTLSAGVRWEPQMAQKYLSAAMLVWDKDAFLRGEKTQQWTNAPPGFFFEGDPQYPTDNSYPLYSHWNTFAPRIGFVWDPIGDGKTVIRSAYGLFYEVMHTEFHLSAAKSSPLGAKVGFTNVSFDNPYGGVAGGSPFPYTPGKDAPFPEGGLFNTQEPTARAPYSQQWNLGIQREIMPNWLVSGSYIGNLVIHVYGAQELNPAVYIPGLADATGQCYTTVEGRAVALRVTAGATCSTTGNTQARRVLQLLNPTEGSKVSYFAKWDDGGTRTYHGMLLNVQKRMSNNYSLTANYTWGHCIGNIANVFINSSPGGTNNYKDPNNRDYDRGNCVSEGSDVRHIGNATGVIQIPQLSNTWAQRVLGNWRVSGILRASTGSAFDVVSGADRQLSSRHTTAQRANQLRPDPYGNQCTNDLSSTGTCFWLDRAAFGLPDLGTLGNSQIGAVFGPGSWTIDAGLSRTFNITEGQHIEFRAESNNVLNHTNFNSPSGNLNSGQFGRIQSARDPRIMQFALKYVF